MGRAIDVDKRLDDLEFKVNEILLMLDELSKVNTTQEHIDIHEATKEQKSNDEGSSVSDSKSNKSKSASNNEPSKNSRSSKWLHRV